VSQHIHCVVSGVFQFNREPFISRLVRQLFRFLMSGVYDQSEKEIVKKSEETLLDK
jgi:hypothetical protein